MYQRLLIALIGTLLLTAAGNQSAAAAAPPQQSATAFDITFDNGAVRLAGTYFRPAGNAPFPAVVIIHGSGPDSRTPYLPDARLLAESGIATLIYDKRGTGSSSGDWRTATLDDLMGDGLAALAWLRQQPEVAADRVGLLGSSQGAWLAPFMAARSDDVAFFVQVTGSATPLANQEMWDDGNSLHAAGFSERAIQLEMKGLHLLYSSRNLVRAGILPLGDLWFVHKNPYLDPADAWAAVDVPALALFGGRDGTVPVADSAAIVGAALSDGGHPASRVVVFPDLGHALGGPARNDDPQYSALVTGWIGSVTAGKLPAAAAGAGTVPPAGDLRWYGSGAQETPWYGTAGVQLPLILIFLLLFALLALLALLPRSDLGARRHRLLLGAAAGLNLLLLLGLVQAINYLLNADAEGYGPTVPLGNWLFPLSWISLALAGALTWQWRTGNPALPSRRLYGAAALAAWAFQAFLLYWGVQGGPL